MQTLRQATGELQGLPLLGMLSSPVMPATVLCALLCCLCGYVAFRMLQAQEASITASLADSTSSSKPEKHSGTVCSPLEITPKR